MQPALAPGGAVVPLLPNATRLFVLFILCVRVLHLNLYMCATRVPNTYRSHRRVLVVGAGK